MEPTILKFPIELSGTGVYKPLDLKSEPVILRLPSYEFNLARYHQQKFIEDNAAIEQIKVRTEIRKSPPFVPDVSPTIASLNYENSFLGQ